LSTRSTLISAAPEALCGVLGAVAPEFSVIVPAAEEEPAAAEEAAAVVEAAFPARAG